MDESTTITTTFRFSSGLILSLNEDQIEKIPYLTALVSAANYFESICDEDGHYKLDSHINYEHFSFVLESLSFHSARQLFTRLPKHIDIISIIDLLGFLGLGPQSDPTLNEVDSIFFSTMVYSPLLKKQLQIVRPTVIQDMAVRFAIAMAKEEYDFTKQKVIDHIYWFIMFILSANNLFGPRLRHHIYRIAEHCFSIFKPSLLKSLKRLILRTEKEPRKSILTTYDLDISPDEENKCPMEQVLDVEYLRWFNQDLLLWSSTLEDRKELLLYRIYRKSFWTSYFSEHSTKDCLESAYKRVLEIMYERLQSDICQCAIVELHDRKKPCKFVQIDIVNSILTFYVTERKTLPKRIDDFLKSESVQEEICERILEEIYFLTPKLERRYVELVERIRQYQQWLGIPDENEYDPYYILPFDTSYFESMQEEALSIELVLGKSPQDSNIFEDLYKRVLDGLSESALKQFNQWENTQKDIDDLYQELLSFQPSKESRSDSSKTIHQHHRIPVNKPLFKHQLKYSGR